MNKNIFKIKFYLIFICFLETNSFFLKKFIFKSKDYISDKILNPV